MNCDAINKKVKLIKLKHMKEKGDNIRSDSTSTYFHLFDDEPNDIDVDVLNQINNISFDDKSSNKNSESHSPIKSEVKNNNKKNDKAEASKVKKINKKNSSSVVLPKVSPVKSPVVTKGKSKVTTSTKDTGKKVDKRIEASQQKTNKLSKIDIKYNRPYRDKANSRLDNISPIHVTTKEHEYVKQKAAICGMTVTEYCRRLILGYKPKQALNTEQKMLLVDEEEILNHLRKMKNFFNKDRRDPKVWEELTNALRILTNNIKKMKQ